MLLSFHMLNALTFNIGIFPMWAAASTIVFFPPAEVRRVLRRIAASVHNLAVGAGIRIVPMRREAAAIAHAVAVAAGKAHEALVFRGPVVQPAARSEKMGGDGDRTPDGGLRASAAAVWRVSRLARLALLAHVAIQIAMPLRHHVSDDRAAGLAVMWTDTNHLFSWRMKLRRRKCLGRISERDTEVFFIRAPGVKGGEWSVYDAVSSGLEVHALRTSLATPQMILRHAQFVHRTVLGGDPDAEIYARIACSLNHRDAQWFIDPRANLARAEPLPWTWDIYAPRTPAWIVPLHQDLPYSFWDLETWRNPQAAPRDSFGAELEGNVNLIERDSA
jgi:hypothetical protein